MRIFAQLTLLSTLAIAHPIQAQDPPTLPPAHHHASSAVIDGASNPELIPDLTAYRLFLVAVSRPPDPPDNEVIHQAVQLSKIGLQEADRKATIIILASFNSRYHDFINSYNEAATAAWARGEHLDAASFLADRDRLVQSTCDALKAGLSSDGWSRLDAHVKGEKQRMKISAKETVQ